jgi:hypothetical protein
MTRRLWAERGRRRAAKLGIDAARLPPGQSWTVRPPAARGVRRTPRGG